jgi:GH24 family phage-related lysozyme (muramidase)
MKRVYEFDATGREIKPIVNVVDFLILGLLLMALVCYQSSQKSEKDAKSENIASEPIKSTDLHNTTEKPKKSEETQQMKPQRQKAPIEYTEIEQIFDYYEIAVWYLKNMESLRLQSYRDGKTIIEGKKVPRYSIGWGTIGRKDQTITYGQANEAFTKAYEKRYQYIKSEYPDCNKWERHILTTIRYNVGSFHRFNGELDKAIKSWNEPMIAKALMRYNTDSSGKVREGLTRRRKEDIKMLLMDKSQRQKTGKALKDSLQKKISKEIGKPIRTKRRTFKT